MQDKEFYLQKYKKSDLQKIMGSDLHIYSKEHFLKDLLLNKKIYIYDTKRHEIIIANKKLKELKDKGTLKELLSVSEIKNFVDINNKKLMTQDKLLFFISEFIFKKIFSIENIHAWQEIENKILKQKFKEDYENCTLLEMDLSIPFKLKNDNLTLELIKKMYVEYFLELDLCEFEEDHHYAKKYNPIKKECRILLEKLILNSTKKAEKSKSPSNRL